MSIFGTFNRAVQLADRAHSTQTDRSGAPYIHHIERVVQNTRSLIDKLLPPDYFSEDEKLEALMVAALHDAVEDTEITGVSYADLEAEGIPAAVIRRVKRLDKANKVGRTYQENIEAMAAEGDLIVMLVKLADNNDNRDPKRVATLKPEERSIVNRYNRSAETLEAGIRRLMIY